uniref:Cuticle protein 6 n=1 Tax=Timema tahoe TaxID=61484 RepID=A0A7R9FKL3_9NEOP|nr:unnamed protein product [Timema tahoe]
MNRPEGLMHIATVTSALRTAEIVFSCVLALAAATPGYLGSPLAASYAGPYAAGPYAAGIYGAGIYGATPYAAAPLAAAVPHAASVSTQYHAQDELGQYSYGYSGGPSAKQETRTLDGVTRGGYSYIDAHGLVQSASYVSDPINGFRVAATNLPVGPSAPAPVHAVPAVAVHSAGIAAPVITPSLVDPVAIAAGAPLPVGDTPEVIAAKINHYNAHYQAQDELGQYSYGYADGNSVKHESRAVDGTTHGAYSYVDGNGIVQSVKYHADALAAAVPHAASVSTQYHAQDELGQYSYGYSGGPSAKQETRTLDGVTRGGYSYIDAHGLVQSASYVSDPINGFRVAATNLPVGPSAPAPVHAVPAVAVHSAGIAAPVITPSLVDPVAIAAGAPLPVGDTPEYQAQDELGQYSYGYADGNSVKHESRAVDGTTHGAYSYVDGNGIVQSVKYHADALASPLVAPKPVQDTPEVAQARAEHLAAVERAAAAAAAAPEDELGQYSYGYAGGLSAKSEVKSFDGVTRGGYSYVDANGELQTVSYTADALNGFRVAATNLPKDPTPIESAPLVAPEPVQDTPELEILNFFFVC